MTRTLVFELSVGDLWPHSLYAAVDLPKYQIEQLLVRMDQVAADPDDAVLSYTYWWRNDYRVFSHFAEKDLDVLESIENAGDVEVLDDRVLEQVEGYECRISYVTVTVYKDHISWHFWPKHSDNPFAFEGASVYKATLMLIHAGYDVLAPFNTSNVYGS